MVKDTDVNHTIIFYSLSLTFYFCFLFVSKKSFDQIHFLLYFDQSPQDMSKNNKCNREYKRSLIKMIKNI